MDAELVEYELERAHIPFEARRVDTREAFLRELDEFGPDLILSDYTLPRFDGMAALALARERVPTIPFLIVTGSVNEETAVGCMKAGATDYLLKSNLARIGPAIEGALARVRARSGEGGGGGGAASLGGQSPRHLRQQPPGLSAHRSRRHHQGPQLHRRRVERPAPRPHLARGRAGRPTSCPRPLDAFRAALGGEVRHVERCFSDTDGSEIWFETTHAPVVDERGVGDRRLPQRARHQQPEAGGAGAPRERGALPRPLRQRQRPGLRHRSRRSVPLREPRLAGRHRDLRGGSPPPPIPGRGASRQPGALHRGGGAGARRRDADPRRAGADDRPATRRSRWRATSAAPSRTGGRSWCAASTATSPSASGSRTSCAGRSGCRPPGGWPAAWRTRSTT